MAQNLIEINSDRKLINLTNHPLITSVTRKAKVHQVNPNYANKTVTLVIDVLHYNEQGVLMGGINNRCEITADNTDIVNILTGDEIPKDANGNYIVDEEGNYPNGSIRNFDFLWKLVNIDKVMTMEEAEDLHVTKRISKINSKLYNI